jgi:hypothetical protein
MSYNSKIFESFSNRTIKAGENSRYRIGDQVCPSNGWLVVWACDQANQLTLKIQASVATAGSLSTIIIDGADMSRHGCLAVPWPVLELSVSCDSTDTEITLSAYGINQGSGVGGYPSKIYKHERKTIASGATGTFSLQQGATRWCALGSTAATVKFQNSNGDDILAYALATGNVTIGADSGSPWYETIEAGQVIISQATGSNQDWTVVQEYDLQIGSGLA